MAENSTLLTIEEARADHHERAVARAYDCVCFATVTSKDIAAELIDKAVEIRAAARRVREPLEAAHAATGQRIRLAGASEAQVYSPPG